MPLPTHHPTSREILLGFQKPTEDPPTGRSLEKTSVVVVIIFTEDLKSGEKFGSSEDLRLSEVLTEDRSVDLTPDLESKEDYTEEDLVTNEDSMESKAE